jgi:ribosome modulation factor
MTKSTDADRQEPKRDSPAYRAGRRAYLDGWDFDDNPWTRKDSDKRTEWFVGWLDARSANKYGTNF